MLLHHERWAARPAWHALSRPERIDYLDRLGPSLQGLLDDGAVLLGANMAEAACSDRSIYYRALWAMTGPAQVRQFHTILERAGWLEYFASVDAEASTPTRTRPDDRRA